MWGMGNSRIDKIDLNFNELEFRIEQLLCSERNEKYNRIRRKQSDDNKIDIDGTIHIILSLCKDILLTKDADIKSFERYVKFIKAVCHVRRREYSEAISELKDIGYDNYWIYKQNNEELYKEMIKYEIKKPIGLEDPDKYLSFCKEIYDNIFEIMDHLIIDKSSISQLLRTPETPTLEIVHYTTRKVAEKLIFDKKSIRMCSVVTSNDPSEGHVLYDLLNMANPNNDKYQCFISCFTFNSDRLNQFRLYGKENNEEGTGVSICYDASAFMHSISDQLKLKNKSDFYESLFHFPLFRCFYIYPSEKNIISIGCADNESKDSIEFRIKGIEKTLNLLKKNINEFLTNSIFIKEEQEKIISWMLTDLCYLTKHAAFKEEQECRLFTIQKLRKNEYIKFCPEEQRMFIEYDKLSIDSLLRVTFGPRVKPSEYLLFKDRLEFTDDSDKDRDNNVRCIISKAPLT
jgi:hypothetical protein